MAGPSPIVSSSIRATLDTQYMKFLIARFARIYPLHVAALMGVIAIECARSYLIIVHGVPSERGPFPDLPGLASQFLMLQGIGPFGTHSWNDPAWSISTEFLAYLLFPWLVRVTLRWPSYAGCVAAAALVILYGGVVALPEFYFDPLRCLAEFCLGIATYGLFVADSLPFLAGDVAMVSIWAFVICSLHFGASPIWSVLAFPLLVLVCARPLGRFSSVLAFEPLRFLGTISFSIYLTQTFVLTAIGFALRFFPRIASPDTTSTFVVQIAMVIGFSVMTYYWIERPARQWVRTFLELRLLPRSTEQARKGASRA